MQAGLGWGWVGVLQKLRRDLPTAGVRKVYTDCAPSNVLAHAVSRPSSSAVMDTVAPMIRSEQHSFRL